MITQEGDRFDILAYDLLGDTCHTPALMQQNRGLINLDCDIEVGTKLYLPENIEPIKNNETALPPWQRQ